VGPPFLPLPWGFNLGGADAPGGLFFFLSANGVGWVSPFLFPLRFKKKKRVGGGDFPFFPEDGTFPLPG